MRVGRARRTWGSPAGPRPSSMCRSGWRVPTPKKQRENGPVEKDRHRPQQTAFPRRTGGLSFENDGDTSRYFFTSRRGCSRNAIAGVRKTPGENRGRGRRTPFRIPTNAEVEGRHDSGAQCTPSLVPPPADAREHCGDLLPAIREREARGLRRPLDSCSHDDCGDPRGPDGASHPKWTSLEYCSQRRGPTRRPPRARQQAP